MTPNLTPILTISIGTAIAAITLIFFFTTLLVLTYTQEIRSFLLWIGFLHTDFRTTPFLTHYVLPYQQSKLDQLWAHMGESIATMTNMRTTCHQTTTIVQQKFSDEYFSCQEDIPRNATPGPSNVYQTPTPKPNHKPLLVIGLWPPNQGPTFPELDDLPLQITHPRPPTTRAVASGPHHLEPNPSSGTNP